MIFLGFMLVKTKTLSTQDNKVASKVILSIVSPYAILTSFIIEFTLSKLFGLGLALLGASIVHAIYIPLTELSGKILGFIPTEKVTVIYSSSGDLIIPLVSAILGRERVLYTSGCMIVQTMLLWTHTESLVYNERQYNIRKIFLNVNVIAIMIGIILFLSQFQLPELAVTTFDKVGSMIGPLAMIVIGTLIGEMNFKDVFSEKRTYLICFMRLVVYPFIIVLVFQFIGLSTISSNANQIFLTTILAASVSATAIITQFTQLYNKHPGYASIMNVMSAIFSIVSMPLMVVIYQLF